MPVSTCLDGSSWSSPFGVAVVLDEDEVPELDVAGAVGVDGAHMAGLAGWSQASGPRSRWISLHGPQGPVSPISQKLSFSSKRCTRLGGRPLMRRHNPSASSSLRNTVA